MAAPELVPNPDDQTPVEPKEDINSFEVLKTALTQIKGLLEAEQFQPVKDALKKLATAIPQINTMLELVVETIDLVSTQIEGFNSDNFPLDTVLPFARQLYDMLLAAEALLPEEEAIGNARVATSALATLPELDELKSELTGLLTTVKEQVEQLEAA